MCSPYDLVGPVLPQALRLARYQASPTLPNDTNEIVTEDDVINQTPSREEERLLASNASVVIALENLFSWREKDRTSRTSRLSRIESIRFQRAIYRIWLMSVLFGTRRFVLGHPFSTENYADEAENAAKNRKDQKSFLQQYSSPELLQIIRLSRFLGSTACQSVTTEGRGSGGMMELYDWQGMFLFAGPHIILRCYEDTTTDHLPSMQYLSDDPYSGFLTGALSEITEERQVDLNAPIGFVGIILDGINGEHDRCHSCGGGGEAHTLISRFFEPAARIPVQLYNKTNWGDMKGDIAMEHEFLLAGNLSLNLVEGSPLRKALLGDWERLVHEMFACRSDKYSKWSKEDWICTTCWISFFTDTLWRWRHSQKSKASELTSSMKDCKYGYDCRKQRYENGSAHAEQFNHLCAPLEILAKTSEIE